MSVGKEEIRNRFGYHRLDGEVAIKMYEQVREAFITMADYLDAVIPDGRAKSSAFTKLQESSMWANFAIAELSPVVDSEPNKNPV